jgi:hypothetical protein
MTTSATTATWQARLTRPDILFPLWGAVLIVGIAVVALLGAPLPTTAEQLAEAYSPPTPVTEEVARESAETIIRIEYPEFVGVVPTVERRTDFGIARFLILYSKPDELAGVRISIVVGSGRVDVSSFN